jgi:lipopolysaccharide transport system ATP-binding protein
MSCIFTFYDHLGQAVASFNSAVHSPEDSHDPELGSRFICELDELLLVPGQYRMNVAVMGDGELQDHIEAAAAFDVEEGQVRGRPVTGGSTYGNVCLQHRWTLPA